MTDFRTDMSREDLELNAKALGFDHTSSDGIIAAAMVCDEAFREQVIEFFFQRAIKQVRGENVDDLTAC